MLEENGIEKKECESLYIKAFHLMIIIIDIFIRMIKTLLCKHHNNEIIAMSNRK